MAREVEMMADGTFRDLADGAVARLGSGRPVGVRLSRTDRRDVVTAEARHRDTVRFGRVVETTYRLNGDRITQRAAELLVLAFGPPRRDPGHGGEDDAG